MNKPVIITAELTKRDGVPDSYAKAIEESCVRQLFDKAHAEVLVFDQEYTIKLKRHQQRNPLARSTTYQFFLELTKKEGKQM